MNNFYDSCFASSTHPMVNIGKWEEMTNLIATLFSSKSAVIIQYRANEFKTVAASADKDGLLKKFDSWSGEEKSFCREIMETGEDLYVNDAQALPEWQHTDPVRSYLGFPIYWPNGTFFGTICAIDSEVTHYDDTLVKLLGTLRDLIAKDLKIVEDYERIFSMAVTVATDGGLKDVLDLLARSVEAVALDAGTKCTVLLLEDGKYLRHAAGPSLPQFYFDAIDGAEIGPTQGSCGAAAWTKEAVFVEDVLTHPNWVPFVELARQVGFRACWSQPILSMDGEVLGTFAMYHDEPMLPTEAQVEMIQGCVLNARIAIEHDRMIADLDTARRSAEMANHAKTVFLNNMSHELRTPLNAIIGFADTIQKEIYGPIGNERYAEYTNHILDSGYFLLNLINNMLQINRIEKGEFEVEIGRFDVAQAVQDSLLVVSLQAEKRGLTFDLRIAPETVFISVDGQHLKQILLNLINNAVKFTSEGDEIVISSTVSQESVEIVIQDHGPGIPSDKLDLIFVPFVRVDNGYTTNADGFGLGLPLSKTLTEKNGGALRLESGTGQGTRAYLSLPKAHSPPILVDTDVA